MWFLLDKDGNTLATFDTDTEAYEASYDDETFPDVYEVAFIQDA
jgi:hypothetical protein